jgi:hypothetical protein
MCFLRGPASLHLKSHPLSSHTRQLPESGFTAVLLGDRGVLPALAAAAVAAVVVAAVLREGEVAVAVAVAGGRERYEGTGLKLSSQSSTPAPLVWSGLSLSANIGAPLVGDRVERLRARRTK